MTMSTQLTFKAVLAKQSDTHKVISFAATTLRNSSVRKYRPCCAGQFWDYSRLSKTTDRLPNKRNQGLSGRRRRCPTQPYRGCFYRSRLRRENRRWICRTTDRYFEWPGRPGRRWTAKTIGLKRSARGGLPGLRLRVNLP